MGVGLLSLSTCTTTFCMGTFQYLQNNVDQLTSGVTGFVEAFPWGWLVQFSNETYTTEEGTYNAWPSFNTNFVYFYSMLLGLVLVRDARRLGLTAYLSASVAVGTFVCLSMTLPLGYLIKRSQVLEERGKKDDTPLDLGKAGQAMVIGQVLTVLSGFTCAYAGAQGGNAMAWGLGFSAIALVVPLGFALAVWNGGAEKGEPMSKSSITNFLAVCAVVSVAFYGVTIYTGAFPAYGADSSKTWFTDVFLFDSWAFRLCGVLIILEGGGGPLMALGELLFAPFGFLAFANSRLDGVQAREKENNDYLAMES